MRKYAALAFACLQVAAAFAQQRIFRFRESEDLRKVQSRVIRMEESNSFLLTLVSKACLHRFYVNGSGQAKALIVQADEHDSRFVVQRSREERTAQLFYESQYIDGSVSGSTITEVFRCVPSHDFIVVETDLHSGRSAIADTVRATLDERPVHSFSVAGKLCLLTQKARTDYFLLHSFRPGFKSATDTIRLLLPNIGRVSKTHFARPVSNLGDLCAGEKILVLQDNLWLPIHALQPRSKAFLQPGHFILALNALDGTTWSVNIDLLHLNYTIRQFDPMEGNAIEKPVSNTSLLIDSTLIAAVASRSFIRLCFYNNNTGALLGRQTINSANLGSVATSPISKVGDFWSKNNFSEIGLEEFLKKVVNNQLCLSGCREDDHLILTLGTDYTRGGHAIFQGNALTLGSIVFTEGKAPATVSFHSSFQMPNFTPSKKPLRNFVWDRMLMHIWSNASGYSNFSFFYMKGYFYIGHLDSSHEYTVYRFDEKTE